MKEVQSSVEIPVVAIGGINHTNAKQVLLETGVEGLAVVSSIFDAKDVRERCEEMRDIINGAIVEST